MCLDEEYLESRRRGKPTLKPTPFLIDLLIGSSNIFQIMASHLTTRGPALMLSSFEVTIKNNKTNKMASFVSPGIVLGRLGDRKEVLCHRFHPVLQTSVKIRRRNNGRIGIRMVEAGATDKAVVTEYFNNKGFERWRRIYSKDGKVNKVQRDIREGHQETVNKILKWIDEDGDCKGQRFCDAGCGVGSLTLPLVERGALVAASDISKAMVVEARERVEKSLGEAGVNNVSFAICDLEHLGGLYDTVCCVDVLIHYPTENVESMVKHLGSLASKRMIVSFAPWTFWLGILKKIGEFFPGPSKATRAYLHKEDDVRKALQSCGWKVRRSEFTGSKFYFSKILEVVKDPNFDGGSTEAT